MEVIPRAPRVYIHAAANDGILVRAAGKDRAIKLTMPFADARHKRCPFQLAAKQGAALEQVVGVAGETEACAKLTGCVHAYRRRGMGEVAVNVPNPASA